MKAKLIQKLNSNEAVEFIVYYECDTSIAVVGVYDNFDEAVANFEAAVKCLSKANKVETSSQADLSYSLAKEFYNLMAPAFQELAKKSVTFKQMLLLQFVVAAPDYINLGIGLMKKSLFSAIFEEEIEPSEGIAFAPLSSIASYTIEKSDTYIGEREGDIKFTTNIKIKVKNKSNTMVKFFMTSTFFYNPDDIAYSKNMHFQNFHCHSHNVNLQPHDSCIISSSFFRDKNGDDRYYSKADIFTFGIGKNGNIYYIPMLNTTFRYNSPLFTSFRVPVTERLTALTKFIDFT